jgi:hypothetical protein
MDGHAVCVEELAIVHGCLECQFTGVCVEGRIEFDGVAQVHWRDL